MHSSAIPRRCPVATPDPTPTPCHSQPQPVSRAGAQISPADLFPELIGQEAMVRTLANAIARDRLAHAFLMTGVRGVGKGTSTAAADRQDIELHRAGTGRGGPYHRPLRHVRGLCRPSPQGPSYDVIGDGTRPPITGIGTTSAKIIEAVALWARGLGALQDLHQSTKFTCCPRRPSRGWLKTLEEPPPHVKFLFANHRGSTSCRSRVLEAPPHNSGSTCVRSRRNAGRNIYAKVCRLEGVVADDGGAVGGGGNQIAPLRKDRCATACRSSIRRFAPCRSGRRRQGQPPARVSRHAWASPTRSAQRRVLGHPARGDAQMRCGRRWMNNMRCGVEPLALMRALNGSTPPGVTLAQDNRAPKPRCPERMKNAPAA